VLVLWQKEGEVYRAYAPKYPQCAAEGSSPEEVGEKVTAILRRHLASQSNGYGDPFAIMLGEDQRRKDGLLSEFNGLDEEMIQEELDPAMLDVIDELNRRVKTGMTRAEILAQFEEILLEEERQGRKWYSSEECLADLERCKREAQSHSEGQA
jgi:hypothetical protein